MNKLLSVILLLLSLPSWGAEFFIDWSGTGSGSTDGSSVSNQCAGINDASCAEAAGNTYYLCGNAAASIDVPASGTDNTARIDYDLTCPGGTPGNGNGYRIVGTGRNYWGVNGGQFNGSPANTSAVACFICETSKGGSCSSREAACEGFRVTNVKINDSAKSGIEIGTVGGQTSYGQTTDVVITGNTIERPSAHGIIMAGNIVNPSEGNNTVSYANYGGAFNSWGIYTAPRAGNCAVSTGCAANWVTAGFTCAAGSFTQYKITLPQTTAGGTTLAANEVVTQVIVQGNANGHYATQSAAGCNPGAGLGSRRWCQDGADIHVCGTELNPPTDNDVTIVTSAHGPVTIGRGDEVSYTNNDGGTDDGVGIGSDIGARNVTIEGVYTHHNQGRGAEFNMCPTGCSFRSSISAYNGTWGFLANNMANATDVVSGYNLVAFGNGSEPFRISNAGATAVQLFNSTLIGTGSQNCVNVALGGGEGGNHSRNCTATHLTTGITGDPQFLGGTNPTTAEGFKPFATSPLCGAGYPTSAKYDYANKRLGNPPNIGAYGTCTAGRSSYSTRSTYVPR